MYLYRTLEPKKKKKKGYFQNQYKHIKLPEKINCNICEITKIVNEDNFGFHTLNKARKAISINGDEYREHLINGSTPECYRCSVCGDRSVTELKCMDCMTWFDISHFSKQQRKDPENAFCKKCVQENLDRPVIQEEEHERILEECRAEAAREAAEGWNVNYSKDDSTKVCKVSYEEDFDDLPIVIRKTTTVGGEVCDVNYNEDDYDDAQTVTSNTTTVTPSEFGVSSSIAGGSVSVASDTDSEIAGSSEAAPNAVNVADDGFIQVGPTKRNKNNFGSNQSYDKLGSIKGYDEINGWKNGNTVFDPTKYRSNYGHNKSNGNLGNNGRQTNRWIDSFNEFDSTKYGSKKRVRAKRPSPWISNKEMKKINAENEANPHLFRSFTEEEWNDWGNKNSKVENKITTGWGSVVPEVHPDVNSGW